MNGLGQIGAPQQEQVAQQQSQGLGSLAPQRNSSLEMFELANAERMKAREMKLENEAMKAKAEQQMLQSERVSMVDNQILEGLKNGQIDEKTAWNIFKDKNISQSTKQAVADVFYPNQALREVENPYYYNNDDAMAYEPRTMNVPDEARQAKIDARNASLGKAGERNMQFVDPEEESMRRRVIVNHTDFPDF